MPATADPRDLTDGRDHDPPLRGAGVTVAELTASGSLPAHVVEATAAVLQNGRNVLLAERRGLPVEKSLRTGGDGAPVIPDAGGGAAGQADEAPEPGASPPSTVVDAQRAAAGGC